MCTESFAVRRGAHLYIEQSGGDAESRKEFPLLYLYERRLSGDVTYTRNETINVNYCLSLLYDDYAV